MRVVEKLGEIEMYFLVVRRYAPYTTFGGGFEGDSRTEATVNPLASARTIGVAAFTLRNVAGYEGTSSGSTFDGAGEWVRKVIGRHYSHVTAEISNVDKGRDSISFTLYTAGANPLVPIIAPDIVTYVDFKASFGGPGVLLSGTVRGDTFPNCEVFALDCRANGAMLFDYRTSGGRNFGPLRLLGQKDSTLGLFNVRVALNGETFSAPPQNCAPTKGA